MSDTATKFIIYTLQTNETRQHNKFKSLIFIREAFNL